MPATPGKLRPLSFLPLLAATVLLIGARLAIHGDAFEKICGGAIVVSAILVFIGWVMATHTRTR
jgi:hypothetical protein